jgi:hypothetical protein
MGGFCPSLLCYHCSNAVLVTGRMPMVTMAYGSLPQCLFVVVRGQSLEYFYFPLSKNCQIKHVKELHKNLNKGVPQQLHCQKQKISEISKWSWQSPNGPFDSNQKLDFCSWISISSSLPNLNMCPKQHFFLKMCSTDTKCFVNLGLRKYFIRSPKEGYALSIWLARANCQNRLSMFRREEKYEFAQSLLHDHPCMVVFYTL